MKQVQKLNLCIDHLIEIATGLKRHDVLLLHDLEHELTPTAICAVCIYPVNTTSRSGAGMDYLLQQGFITYHVPSVQVHSTSYWVRRVLYFAAVFVFILLFELWIRSFFLGNEGYFAVTAFDFLLVGVLSLVVFNMLDEAHMH